MFLLLAILVGLAIVNPTPEATPPTPAPIVAAPVSSGADAMIGQIGDRTGGAISPEAPTTSPAPTTPTTVEPTPTTVTPAPTTSTTVAPPAPTTTTTTIAPGPAPLSEQAPCVRLFDDLISFREGDGSHFHAFDFRGQSVTMSGQGELWVQDSNEGDFWFFAYMLSEDSSGWTTAECATASKHPNS